MSLKTRLGDVRRVFKRELQFYQRVAKHPQTPRKAKLLLGAAIGYALMPFDLIPDFIPIIGHLDDAVIVPGLVIWALQSVPQDVIDECRNEALKAEKGTEI